MNEKQATENLVNFLYNGRINEMDMNPKQAKNSVLQALRRKSNNGKLEIIEGSQSRLIEFNESLVIELLKAK